MTFFTNRCTAPPGVGRTRFWNNIKVFLMLFLLVGSFIPTELSAQVNIDGNSSEWVGVGTPPHVQDAFGNGVVDDQFTEGTKDFNFAPNMVWAISQTKAKNDIANGTAIIVNSIQVNGAPYAGTGPYLAFAGDRTSNNGDAQIGFWFFQNGTAPVTVGGNNIFAPEKTVGDLLVLADFTGGGKNADVTVLRWVGTGGSYPNSNGAFDEVTNIGAAVAQNNAGSTALPTGWDFVSASYDINEFYEGFVDLGTFGPGAACFSRFMLETRSSQSITASLDDFVGGPLGGIPTVTVNSGSRCINGAGVTLTATPVPAGTYTYVWTVPAGADDPGNVSSFSATVAGEYCVTVTNTNGCASEPSCGTVIVNPLPTVTADPKSVCTGSSVSLTGSPAGGTWSGDHVTGSTFDATGLAAGPYTVTYTFTDGNGCTNSADAIVTVNSLPIVSCSATGPIDITSAAHSSQLDVSFAGSDDTDPTHYTYSWTEDGSGSLSSLDIKDPVYTAAPGDAGGTVHFTITVINTITGCTSTSNCEVNVIGTGSCPDVPTEPVCGGSTNTYTASVPPTANETWVWSATNGAIINAPNGQQSVSVTAGTQNFTLILTKTFANPDLDPLECPYEVTVTICGSNCTYTQGYYGNKNGNSCDADGTGNGPITYQSPVELMTALLSTDLTVGAGDVSITIPAGSAGAIKLNSVMPGGKTPTELTNTSNCVITDACFNSYLTKGRINNVLLSQTITLGLNMRITSTLSGFEIQAGTLVTAEPLGGCGSTTPKPPVCVYNTEEPYNLISGDGGYTHNTIKQSVIDALDCKGYDHTVAGLFALANDALANAEASKAIGTECGASLSDINDAVDAINKAFDGCKIAIGWDDVPTTCAPFNPPLVVARSSSTSEESIVNQLSVSAYPNPYIDRVRFEIKSPISGQATLEVYNALGQKMKTVYKGFIFAGRGERVDYNVPSLQRTNLFYTLRVGGKQVTGKLINLSR